MWDCYFTVAPNHVLFYTGLLGFQVAVVIDVVTSSYYVLLVTLVSGSYGVISHASQLAFLCTTWKHGQFTCPQTLLRRVTGAMVDGIWE